MIRMLTRLWRDERGAMLIETALIAPTLLLLSLGAYQISGVVARQSELQSAAAEGVAIALATPPDTDAKLLALANVMVASTGLSSDKVSVTRVYRCGTDQTYLASSSSCGTNPVSVYAKIALTSTYTPLWTQFGLGSAINFNVVRYVMYSQVVSN